MADIVGSLRILGGGTIKNARMERLAADPVTPLDGQIWFNTTDLVYKGFDGSSVFTFATGGNAETLQNELDAAELAVGLQSNGTLAAFTGANYIGGSTTIRGALLALDGQASTTAGDLSAETTRATGAESTLTSNLNAEITRATGAESTLTSNLGAEVTRATAAEGTLTSSLNAEITRATGAESTLTSSLNAEITRATAAESTLTSSLGAEITRATEAEGSLITRVGTIEGAYIHKDGSVAFTADQPMGTHKLTGLANGTNPADAVNFSQLGTAIGNLGNAFEYVSTVTGGANVGASFDMDTLTNKHAGAYYKVGTSGYFNVGVVQAAFYVNAGDGLVFNIDGSIDIIDNTNSMVQGTTNYIAVTGNADTGYTVNVDGAFVTRMTTVESGLASEITRATAAESTLTSSLNSEITRATNAESTLTSNLNAEITRATAAEGTLTSSLNAEITRATDAESTLTSNLNAEITRATAAESTLTSNLNAEITRATAAESTLTSSLNAEITRATGVESTLSTTLGNLGGRLDNCFFLYNGSTSSTTHTVTHGIGYKYVTATVVDSTDNVIIPDSIVYTDTNNLVVTFATAITCKVIVVGPKAVA